MTNPCGETHMFFRFVYTFQSMVKSGVYNKKSCSKKSIRCRSSNSFVIWFSVKRLEILIMAFSISAETNYTLKIGKKVVTHVEMILMLTSDSTNGIPKT